DGEPGNHERGAAAAVTGAGVIANPVEQGCVVLEKLLRAVHRIEYCVLSVLHCVLLLVWSWTRQEKRPPRASIAVAVGDLVVVVALQDEHLLITIVVV